MSSAVHNRTTIPEISLGHQAVFCSIKHHFLRVCLPALRRTRKPCFVATAQSLGCRHMGGSSSDEESDIRLQLINVDHTVFLQIISSFYKAWFSTKHTTGFQKEEKNKSSYHNGTAGSRRRRCNCVDKTNVPACLCCRFYHGPEALGPCLDVCVRSRSLSPADSKPENSSEQPDPNQHISQSRDPLRRPTQHLESRSPRATCKRP